MKTKCIQMDEKACPKSKVIRFVPSQLFPFAMILVALTLSHCASTDEVALVRSNVSMLQNRLEDTNRRVSDIKKDNDNISKQVLNVYTSLESRDEKIKNILGKLDELEYQLRTYWNETKTELNALKKAGAPPKIPMKPVEASHDTSSYKDAFEAFQKGAYEEAIQKFAKFIDNNPGASAIPNAYYWIGEAYMNLKNYDKAILNFQEVIDKYGKSEKAPRAMLSQAEAFNNLKDQKSSTTLLKKVIELFPKSEEAVIAERRLRSLGAQ